MFATTTTGAQEKGKVCDYRNIKTEVVNNHVVKVYQLTTTSTRTYVGITESAARAIASPKATGTAGRVECSLGGIKITVAEGGVSAWFSLFGCRGTIVSASAQRDGESELWGATVTTQTMSCTVEGATSVENI